MMDIYCNPGTKVRYLDENGYDGDREYARKFMQKDQTFTVEYVNVGNWSSLVAFRELPGKEFNTAMFEEVDTTTSLED